MARNCRCLKAPTKSQQSAQYIGKNAECCCTGGEDPDAALHRQDDRALALASMLARHLDQLQAGPQLQPGGTLLLSDGFQRRLEQYRLCCVVCIQVWHALRP